MLSVTVSGPKVMIGVGAIGEAGWSTSAAVEVDCSFSVPQQLPEPPLSLPHSPEARTLPAAV